MNFGASPLIFTGIVALASPPGPIAVTLTLTVAIGLSLSSNGTTEIFPPNFSSVASDESIVMPNSSRPPASTSHSVASVAFRLAEYAAPILMSASLALLIVGFGYPEIIYARGVQKERKHKIHRYSEGT